MYKKTRKLPGKKVKNIRKNYEYLNIDYGIEDMYQNSDLLCILDSISLIIMQSNVKRHLLSHTLKKIRYRNHDAYIIQDEKIAVRTELEYYYRLEHFSILFIRRGQYYRHCNRHWGREQLAPEISALYKYEYRDGPYFKDRSTLFLHALSATHKFNTKISNSVFLAVILEL